MRATDDARGTWVFLAVGAVIGLGLGVLVSVVTDVPLAPEAGLVLARSAGGCCVGAATRSRAAVFPRHHQGRLGRATKGGGRPAPGYTDAPSGTNLRSRDAASKTARLGHPQHLRRAPEHERGVHVGLVDARERRVREVDRDVRPFLQAERGRALVGAEAEQARGG